MAAWAQVENVFIEALELPEDRRADFLTAACGGDAELRAEVESLLRSEGRGEEIFPGAVSRLVESLGEAEEGERLGPYRILSQIGEGGMGAVYLACRDDDQFRQRVAIKIVRIPGSVASGRFRHERQILATLEHPNIARLLDGGTSLRGVPYLVMEFVEGKQVTEYCSGLPVEEKIRLFLKVCAAVQHAHRFLVVHRDLKPANILVTAAGEPKLLDFGIAKLLEGGQAQVTAFQTGTGMQMLTADYAAPEQIRGEAITTAADVYALGVVLYELLTGRRAQVITTTSPQEIARVVCEVEPAPPQMGTDLDNILRMALRKEPERRYASVEALAEDLRRYLDNRPVSARADTVRYRVGKFVRRNRWGVVSAVLVTVTLVAGIVGTAWEARRAQRRFDQVRRLANHFLFDFDKEISTLTGATKARQLVVSTALEYLDSLRPDARGDAGLEAEIAEAYEKVGEVQGFSAGANLGRPADAMKSWDKALEIRERLARGDDAQKLKLGFLLVKRGAVKRTLGDSGASLADSRRGVALLDAGGVASPDRVRAHWLLFDLGLDRGGALESLADARQGLALAKELGSRPGSALLRLGIALREAGLLDESRSVYADAVRELETDAVRVPNSSPAKRAVATAALYSGQVLAHEYFPSLGRRAEAAEHYRRAVAIIEQLRDADPNDAQVRRDLNTHRLNLAMAIGLWEGRTSEAVKTVAAIVELNEVPRRAGHANVVELDRAESSHWILSALLEKSGDLAGALREALASSQCVDEIAGMDPASLSGAFDGLRARVQVARLQRLQGDLAGAGRTLAEFAGRAEPLEQKVTSVTVLWRLADYYSERGRIENNRGFREHAVAIWRKLRDRGVSESFVGPRLAAAQAELNQG